MSTAEATPEAEPTPAEEAKPLLAENLYEGMFLVESTRFANDPDKVTGHILELIKKAGGNVVAHRPWQDGKLAYPINGRRKGLHYLTFFKMPPSGMVDLERSCKLSDTVMRKIVIRHGETLFNAMVQAVTAPATPPGEPAPEKPAS